MNYLQKFTIRHRLGLGFGIIIFFIAGLIAVNWSLLGLAREEVENLVDECIPRVELARDIEEGVNIQARMLRNAVISANLNDLRSSNESLEKLSTAIDANSRSMSQLKSMLTSDDGELLFKAMVEARLAYGKARDETIDYLRQGKTEEAARHLLGDVHVAQNAFFDAIERMINFQQSLMATEGKEAKQGISAVINTTLAIGIGLVALSLFLAWSISSSIISPILRAQQLIRAVAAGDLCRRTDITSRDEMGQLLTAVQDMTMRLAAVVSTVRSGSESVASASAQIAHGNGDLSQRTEQQASALEQTAATMEQLSSTVRNNADNAVQANQLAQAASNIATSGRAVVGQVVTTMQNINESSKKISDIIGVIDGIAFQTNILALNAAVEAARAGEQGRGFAVVAGEVRSLAQRSAEAAKEIKFLITRSVEQVAQGTDLVDGAWVAMEDIMTSIQRVSDIVGEISSASIEQSNGIQQVGEAVGQMDQVTQQNAALVEQSAAATESLTDQARQLVLAVSYFKIATNSSVGSTASSSFSQNHPPEGGRTSQVKPAASLSNTHNSSPSAPSITRNDEWVEY